MIIMSLWAWACTSEMKIAQENKESTIIVVDNKEDSWKDDKFLFQKDIQWEKVSNIKQIESDYTSIEFLKDIEEYKWLVDLILINFPNNYYLQYPNNDKSRVVNEQFLKNISETLSDNWKAIITSERNNQEQWLKSMCEHYQTHPSYIPRWLNLDYLSTIKDINDRLTLLESDITNEAVSKIELSWKEIKIYPELWASYKLFSEYFQIKSLILSKIKK